MDQTKPIKVGFTEDAPEVVDGIGIVRSRSSSRLAMLLVAIAVVGTWAAVNIVNVCRAAPSSDGSWAPVAVADFPWVAAVLVVAAMFAKDKPLDKLAEIAAALKR